MGRCSPPFESTYANCVERSFSRSFASSVAMVHLLVPAGIGVCPRLAECGPSGPPSRSHRETRQRARRASHFVACPLRLVRAERVCDIRAPSECEGHARLDRDLAPPGGRLRSRRTPPAPLSPFMGG